MGSAFSCWQGDKITNVLVDTCELKKIVGTFIFCGIPRVTMDILNIQTATELLGVFGGKFIFMSFLWQS